ncbi:ATP-binding protein [Amycolatopsis nigrescens]|uniref:ATP-binding protein n=1 Tax=Amycolatopsis nigrescens TaxID=381445 RepID=UPI00035C0ED8|nr:ATP-binding protein [Amycolatopsis nigrescens]
MTGTLRPAATPAGLAAEDLAHLWDRLGLVEQRVRHAVATRRAVDPDPGNPHRGLYLTPEAVERILSAPAVPPQETAEPPSGPRPGSALARLAENFGLTALDVEFLLVAMAPELDRRFEQLYGYLNDDLTQRRPTVGLALELYDLPAAGAARFRFTANAPLVAGELLEIREPDRPSLSRSLRVPDRVLAHLLGHDEPDPRLAEIAGVPPETARAPDALAARISAALDAGIRLIHLAQAEAGSDGLAADLLARTGRTALAVRAKALTEDPDPRSALAALVREARFSEGGIVLGPVEDLDPGRPERARLLTQLTTLATDVAVILYGTGNWDPAWTHRQPVSIRVEPPTAESRAGDWLRALARVTDRPPEPAVTDLLATYRLGADQVHAATSVATRLALLDQEPVGLAQLRAGVRAQNGAGLARLARRITPAVGMADLVLPEPSRRQLAELTLRARHRDTVLGRWRMRPGGGRGRGVMALFAGESGTGKTMSAEVIAAELGMDLYVVDLSTVVDKYVGETEKNLERIFTEAVGVNGVLLFDEADAIFGKRSAVQDAHDRYANVESAYLLQRMESFDGIAILTTNLRANLDDAFTRRLDVIADFPMPDAAQRLALWDRCLGTAMPRNDDLDLAFCAERFELAGGSIRACAVTAAYLAAASGGRVGMAEVVTAIHQEYRKLGRLVLDHEFGHWLSEAAESAAPPA